MSTLRDNKLIKKIGLLIITITTIIFMLPVTNEVFNIIFKLGKIIGNFIRSYGGC